MNIFAMSGSSSGISAVIEAPEVTRMHMRRNGAHPATFRQVLSDPANDGYRLRLVEDGDFVQGDCVCEDALSWETTVALSSRAKALTVALGVDEGAFLACRIEGVEETYHLYLPVNGIDVINFGTTRFNMVIPADPPIYHRVEQVSLKSGIAPDTLPPMFMNQMPGYQQLLTDIFVTDECKSAWEGAGFTGAVFRPLD